MKSAYSLPPKTLWLTGLSGAGKTTLANALTQYLKAARCFVVPLDGDSVREGLSADLDFTEDDRTENIRRMAEVARLCMQAGAMVVASSISPLQMHRVIAKNIIGASNYVEVFVNTPLAICESRDVKGLYKKARQGLIRDFTGISAPFQPPIAPNIEITHYQSVEESCIHIFNYLIGQQTPAKANPALELSLH